MSIVETFPCDVAVIGAGVVGLAVARALALAGREVLVLEAERATGTITSSRNSEVIHSGLYYPPGSLKARLCVEGREALYAYCAERGVAARRCGKVIVASSEGDGDKLVALAANGRANGVSDLVLMTPDELRTLEPEVVGHSALLCPMTGIVDSHALMQALQHDLEQASGSVCLATPVLGGRVAPAMSLRLGGAEPAVVEPRVTVNAAGLAAPDLMGRLAGFPPAHAPRAYYAKGNYFALTGRSPFRRLVYPLPEPGGIGIHATIDLAGEVRFGPDVEWVDRPDAYAVDPARAVRFYEAIRRYWPALPEGALQPAYAGIRPKLGGPGTPASDFVVQDVETHGIPGLVNLFGIESPGLTSCLAIGSYVAERIEASGC